jgi:hypothetical protein
MQLGRGIYQCGIISERVDVRHCGICISIILIVVVVVVIVTVVAVVVVVVVVVVAIVVVVVVAVVAAVVVAMRKGRGPDNIGRFSHGNLVHLPILHDKTIDVGLRLICHLVHHLSVAFIRDGDYRGGIGNCRLWCSFTGMDWTAIQTVDKSKNETYTRDDFTVMAVPCCSIG